MLISIVACFMHVGARRMLTGRFSSLGKCRKHLGVGWSWGGGPKWEWEGNGVSFLFFSFGPVGVSETVKSISSTQIKLTGPQRIATFADRGSSRGATGVLLSGIF